MLRQVKSKVTGGIFRSRMNINRDYLIELDSQCLLQNFYLEAGIIMPDLQVIPEPEKAKLHWGWESPACQLRGHFLGHFLSAASKLYAYEKDEALKKSRLKIALLTRETLKQGLGLLGIECPDRMLKN